MKHIHVITNDFTPAGVELLLRNQHAEEGRYVEIRLKGEVWTVECTSEQFDQWMITRGDMVDLYHRRQMYIRAKDDPTWTFPYHSTFEHLYFVEGGFKNVVMKMDDLVACIVGYIGELE